MRFIAILLVAVLCLTSLALVGCDQQATESSDTSDVNDDHDSDTDDHGHTDDEAEDEDHHEAD